MITKRENTPSQLEFQMPAEWEEHGATWLAWPHDAITFPKGIDKAEKDFVKIIYHLHLNEHVELLVLDEKMKSAASKILAGNQIDINKITFHIVDYADVWIRDYGPTFLVNKNSGKSAWVKWEYNAYGEKFPDLIKDTKVPLQIADYINQPMFEPKIIMEGGAIDVNGKGTLLTTEECLLNTNRNPELNKEQTENILKNYLGVSNILWLKKGIVGDNTDGHVDELARFVNENTIVYAYEENKDDPNFEILKGNLDILQNAKDQDGKPFNLIKLPMPEVFCEDQKAPASYANFYIANGVVLVPQFCHQNDKPALDILQELFPDRKIIGIDCTNIIYGGGAIHCITQQQPLYP